jgi:type I restriction enzyme M protein
VYDCLLNYWNEKLQDDVYAIKVNGYEAGREIDYEYAKKKAKDENGETISVDDKSKVKSFDGALIPRTIVERTYFADECATITALEEQCGLIESELDEMREEESGEEGLLLEVLNENGDSIPKANLTKRIKELDAKKTSEEADALAQIAALFTAGETDAIVALLKQNPLLAAYELQNKKGAFIKSKIAAALKDALANAILPEIYADEYATLIAYQDKLSMLDEANKKLKDLRKELDEKVEKKYGELTVDEIKHLLFDEKWMVRLPGDIGAEVDQVLNALASKALLIAKRYEHTLKQIEDKTSASKTAVKSALERMGYKW